MELLRTLGALIEAPSPDHDRLAELLELGSVPSPAEHTDVFSFQLYPYASIYLGTEGQLGGEARDRIAGFWRALGETPPPEPDHLTLMLASYAELRSREAAGEPPGGEHWRRACHAFLWEHLLSWLPAYLDKLEELGPDYYRRWAKLLREALAAEVEHLGGPRQISMHLGQASAMEDPRDGDPDGFLVALLSPVRSGLILVRDDLRRAGHELALGVRAGERKYVLKALLSQDPAAILSWLDTECRTWARRHRTAALEGPVSEFWAARAEATSTLLAELSQEAESQNPQEKESSSSS